MWESEESKERHAQRSKIYAIPFTIFSVNLLVSIILTINTPPGSIPEDIEWDMPQSTDPEESKKAF